MPQLTFFLPFFLAFFVFFQALATDAPSQTQATATSQPVTPSTLQPQTNASVVLHKSASAVVNIEVERINRQALATNSAGANDGIAMETEFRFGSGFFVDHHGYIITNEHVVRDVKQVIVRNQDGDEALGTVIGTDPVMDVAVIQTAMPAPAVISLDGSHKPEIGEPVFAIGSSFGLPQSVTYGIVSALHRSISSPLQDFIQTDSAINSGNSGGPLINHRGELLGVNTAIISVRGGNNGVGFAIPTEIVRNIAQQLVTYHDVKPGQIGIHVQTISPSMASALGTSLVKHGVVVTQVLPDTVASSIKLQTKDIITQVNDEPIVSVAQMAAYIYSLRIGSELNITFIRDGKVLQRKTTIPEVATDSDEKTSGVAQGISLTEFKSLQSSGFIKQGLGVLDVVLGSPGWLAGLQVGDLITHVAGNPVTKLADIRSVRLNKPVLVEVLRRDKPVFLVFIPTKVAT